MSKDQKQTLSEEEDHIRNGSDNDQNLNVEVGNGSSGSNLNNTVRTTTDLTINAEQNLPNYGREVSADDVLIIQRLSKEICQEQTSDERLDTSITYEYPSDFDEPQLPKAYFDNTKTLYSQEKIKVLNIKEIHPLSQICKNQNGVAIKRKEKKARDKNIPESYINMTDIENRKIANVLKDKKSSALEMSYNKCQVPKTPFECPCKDPKTLFSDNKYYKFSTSKFTDYSSDEFADIEDNKDSSSDNSEVFTKLQTSNKIQLKEVSLGDSSSDNSEVFAKLQTSRANKIQLKEVSLGARPKQGQKSGNRDTSEALKDIGMQSFSGYEIQPGNISKSKSEDENLMMDNSKPSCSFSSKNESKRMKTIPVAKLADEGYKMNGHMATILEVPELEVASILEVTELEEDNLNSENSQPSYPKNKPLKMKAKVINRKYKCNVCDVRLGLCAIKCRCGGYYCAKHRYDRDHNCTFDYKAMGREEIRANNPKVIAEKVRKL